MMQSPALDHGAPILEREESVKWRDENTVYIQARKSRCHSVWCACCSKQGWAKVAARDLREFDWKKTREIVVTIDPGRFKNGKEAYAYVMEHKLIPGLIRNIKRGKHVKIGKDWIWKYKPVEICKYITFLEWHKNGFPHWHIIIETAEYGRFSQIGGDMIRHYWPVASWVHESFFKSQKHWDYQVGYFEKHGYFDKDKEHQTSLPAWALEIPGLRIRRSTHSRREQGNANEDQGPGQDLEKAPAIDPLTGEILDPGSITYRYRLDSCGRASFLNLYLRGKEVTGLFKIPYQEVRKNYPGQYRAGIGYVFRVSAQEGDKLLSKMIRGEERRYLKTKWLKDRKIIKHWCGICGDWTYQKIQEARDDSDVYLCLRCKTVHEYKEREQEDWRSIGLSTNLGSS
ncbi:hypothetical protein ES703_35694 [subsurface metagenome]